MIFESHAHYDDERYEEDRDNILSSLTQNGIEYVVNVGASIDTTKKTIELAKKYDFVYAAVGVHPSDVGDLNDETFEWLKAQTKFEKTVAVGEIGLDYHYDKDEQTVSEQKKWFIEQLRLAREVKLPVIIHSREAAKDTLDIMLSEKAEEIGGVVHCFSYTKEMALEYLKLGYYIGIGGVVTFSNAKKVKEAVKEIPLERILLETDCPYLAPTPFRGERNSSLYIPYIAEEIARIKEVPVEMVYEQTMKNAKTMFNMEK